MRERAQERAQERERERERKRKMRVCAFVWDWVLERD